MATLAVAIDPSLAVRGAAVVRRAINSIKTSAQSMGNSLSNALSSIKERFSGLSKSLLNFKTGLIAIGAIQIFRSLSSQIGEFEDRMAAVRAVTGAVGDSFDSLVMKARDLGARTRFTATQAAGGMEFLGRAGFTTGQILQSIEPTLHLAQAGFLNLSVAADITSNIMQGFSIQADETRRVADLLAFTASTTNTNIRQLGDGMKFVAPVAAATNVTLRETAAAMGALANAGIQGALGGTSLRAIITQLEDPTAEAEKAMRKLGLTQADWTVGANGLIKTLKNLRDAGVDSTNVFEIFDRRSTSGVLALMKVIEATEEYMKTQKEASGTAERQATIMGETLAGAWDTFNAALQEAILSIGEGEGASGGLSSALITLLKNLTEMTRGITPLARVIGTVLGAAFRTLGLSIESTTSALVLWTKAWTGVLFIVAGGSPLNALERAKVVWAELGEQVDKSADRFGRLIGLDVDAEEKVKKLADARKKAAEDKKAQDAEDEKAAKAQAERRAQIASDLAARGGLREDQFKLLTLTRSRAKGELELREAILARASAQNLTKEQIKVEVELERALRKMRELGIDVNKQFKNEEKTIAEALRDTITRTHEARKATQEYITAQKEAIKAAEKRKENIEEIFFRLEAEEGRLRSLIDAQKLSREEREREAAVAKIVADSLNEKVRLTDEEIKKIRERVKANEELRESLESAVFTRESVEVLENEATKLEDLIAVQKLSRRERAINTIIIRHEARARQQGITLEEEEIARIREQAAAVVDLQEQYRDTKSPLRDFAENSKVTMQDLEQVTVDAFAGMEDAFAEFTTTGKFAWKDLVNSIQQDLAKLAMRQTVTGPLSNLLGGAMGSIGGGGAAATQVTAAGPGIPAGAPPIAGGGFQHGGIVGGGRPGRDRVPIMATRGEGVFTPEQMKAMGGSHVTVTNVWQITAADAASFEDRRTQAQIASRMGQVMQDSMLRNGVRTRRST